MSTQTDPVARYRWLHDKFERAMAQEENRMTGWAEVFLGFNTALAGFIGFLLTRFGTTGIFYWTTVAIAVLGIAGSLSWFFVGRRMQQSWMTWRQMAVALEKHGRGETAELQAVVQVYWRWREVDLNQPIRSAAEIVGKARYGIHPVATITKWAPTTLTIAWTAAGLVTLTCLNPVAAIALAIVSAVIAAIVLIRSWPVGRAARLRAGL
jgi:hypothetical protein